MHLSVLALILPAIDLAAAAAVTRRQRSAAVIPSTGLLLALALPTANTSALSFDTELTTEKGVEVTFDSDPSGGAVGATCILSLQNPASIVGDGMASVTQVAGISLDDNLVEFNVFDGGFSGSMTFSQSANSVVFDPDTIPCQQNISLRIRPNILGAAASMNWTQDSTLNSGLILSATG